MSNVSSITKALDHLLVKCPEWRELLSHRYAHYKRYIKFIDAYLVSNRDLERVGKNFAFNLNDITNLFEKMVRRVNEVYQIEQEKNQWVEVYVDVPVSPLCMEEELLIQADKKYLVSRVIEKSSVLANLQEVLPERLYMMINLLMVHKDLKKVSEQMGVGEGYILQRLVGRPQPRKPCERGALYYLESEKGIVKTKKVKRKVKKSELEAS